MNLSPNEFNEEGLYLIFPDKTRMVITQEKNDKELEKSFSEFEKE